MGKFAKLPAMLAVMSLSGPLLLTGCTEGGNFEPPAPHTFPEEGGEVVLINPPVGENVVTYVTSDGEDPNVEDCDPYDGTPIPITTLRDIKVLYVVDGVEMPIVAGAFSVEITDTGAGVPTANKDLLDAWLAWEADTRCELNTVRGNAGCADPTGIDALGTVDYSCPGGGNVSWEISISGTSTFTYNNCSYDSIDEGNGNNLNSLTVNGTLSGTFNTSGSGSTSGTLTISGDRNGTVEDAIVISERVKTGGKYTVNCSDDGCADAPAIYVAPNWAYVDENAGPDDALSCSEPLVTITQNRDGECLTVADNGSNLTVAACSPGDLKQQFVVTGSDGDYGIMHADSQTCLQDSGDDFILTACNADEATQGFDIHGSNSDGWFIENTARDACLYQYPGAFYNDGLAYAGNGNCTWASLGYPSMKWSFHDEEGTEVTAAEAANL